MKTREDQTYLPTPQRIRGMCHKIRASWSENERRRRLITAEWTPWRVPEICVPEGVGDHFESE